MANLGQNLNIPIRTLSKNKESEWSALCDNVFDEYLDGDDIFAPTTDLSARRSSEDSANLFDFSTGSEQSHQTADTSPLPSWEYPVASSYDFTVADQPKAREPATFWTKTLRALENNAAASVKQKTLRAAKSHPDFLSLGGWPSPPAGGTAFEAQTFSVPRHRPRQVTNGIKASQARSISRGRPTGITRNITQHTVGPSATVKKRSTSPIKMMTPSRFCAGFRELWNERTKGQTNKYELSVPPTSLFLDSPPSSAREQLEQRAFAAFSPPMQSRYDDQVSPLTQTFQRARIYTPTATPHTAPYNCHDGLDAFFPPTTLSHPAQAIPLNDWHDPFQEHTASSGADQLHGFDFGFSDAPSSTAYATASYTLPNDMAYTSNHYTNVDPFGCADLGVLPSIESPDDFAHGGLGISLNPALISKNTMAPDTAAMPGPRYESELTLPRTRPSRTRATAPNTPSRRSKSVMRSESPSPLAAQSCLRSRSGRASSRHRRAKSTNSTPRHRHSLDKGGFVNFTPQDSNKILSGVAPSGSSKTKARREKEAADKRRRFSQAAVRAVVEAGGDLDALNKSGIIDLASNI